MKKLLILFGLLLASPSFAADNAVIVTPGVGVTMKSKDIGAGVQAMQPVISDTGGNPLSTPTAGADGVSNTSTGLLGYSRNLVFNGTTWDRWLGDATNGGFVNVKTSVLPTGSATSANQSTIITSLGTIITNTGAAIPAGSALIGKVGIDQTTPGTTNLVAAGQVSQYPIGAVPITASATGTTGATTATLAASASIKTYVCGFSIRANATAAVTGNATVTGPVTGTLNYTQWTAPNASGLGITEMIFAPCVPSSAINTAIAVISAAPGTGGVVSVSAWGYQL